MVIKRILVLLGLALVVVSCGEDDNGIVTVPPRLLAEVAPENDDEIREYLSTHFYNYEEFENPPAGFDFRLVIDTIAGDNIDKTPLLDQVSTATVDVSYTEFALEEVEEDMSTDESRHATKHGDVFQNGVQEPPRGRSKGTFLELGGSRNILTTTCSQTDGRSH